MFFKGVNMKYKFHDGGRSNTAFRKKTDLGDCVVRALTLATNLDYTLVWHELCDIAKLTGRYPNEKETYEMFLFKYEWVKQKTPRDKNKKLISIMRWDYKGAAVISTSSHLVYVNNKTIFDTWDCRTSKIYNYYA
jgi:hypothetical protein